MKYKIETTSLTGVLLLTPEFDGEEESSFSFDLRAFQAAIHADVKFVQDNHSHSKKGVLRGLHYQIQNPQGKLIQVVRGTIFDVTVDLRKSSATFGQWSAVELSEENKRQLWIPPGFAHGFMVLSDSADVLYKTTDYYNPEAERCLAWNDPATGIVWPTGVNPILSEKDSVGISLADAEVFD